MVSQGSRLIFKSRGHATFLQARPYNYGAFFNSDSFTETKDESDSDDETEIQKDEVYLINMYFK